MFSFRIVGYESEAWLRGHSVDLNKVVVGLDDTIHYLAAQVNQWMSMTRLARSMQ